VALDLLSSAVNHDVWFRTELDTPRKTLGPSNVSSPTIVASAGTSFWRKSAIDWGRTNESRVLVLRVLHDKMDYLRHLEGDDTTKDEW